MQLFPHADSTFLYLLQERLNWCDVSYLTFSATRLFTYVSFICTQAYICIY